MPYDLKLTQINTSAFGLGHANTTLGFPANTNFHTLLMSFWMCGPAAAAGFTGVAGIWPSFVGAGLYGFAPGANGITLTNQTLGSSGHFYQGGFSLPPPNGMLVHVMLSVDTHAQIVQLYINDQSISVTGGSWTGTPPFDFNVPAPTSLWFWNVSNVGGSGRFPALADCWISNTSSFVDLSVTANRRKFINANLTPVDLGDAGTTPFGYQPALYMSVRPGGVPTDIAINLGSGGGAWNFSGGAVPTFQTPGLCTLPTPPPTNTLRVMILS